MSWFIVDVESDGRAPGLYSMINFGAVRFDEHLDRTFYGETRPISTNWDPESLAICGIAREAHEQFEDPAIVMQRFFQWVLDNTVGEAKLWSDNPAFDWQFINYYFIAFCRDNPFGHSARRIGDLYAGIQRNARAGSEWRKLAVTPHTHHPLDDAKGHAEALRELVRKYDIKGIDWSR